MSLLGILSMFAFSVITSKLKISFWSNGCKKLFGQMFIKKTGQMFIKKLWSNVYKKLFGQILIRNFM